MLILAVQVRTL